MYGYRTWWLAAFASLAFGSASVQASPISYGFSGTLAQPFDGATTFSGSFTYDTDLPIYPGLGGGYPGWSYYSGVPADPSEPVLSLTFNVGNLSSASLLPVEMDDLVVSHTQLSDSFDIQETLSYAKGQNLTATFGMSSNNLVERAPFSSTDPPPSLNLADFSGANFSLEGTTAAGQQLNVIGTVTSLVPLSDPQVPVPEPGSVLIFVVAGAVAWVRLRRGRRPRT